MNRLPLLVLIFIAGCGFPSDVPLESFGKKEFEAVRESSQWEIFTGTPLHELDETRISKRDLSICAMVATFTEGTNRTLHERCKRVILVDSNLMTGTALANLMDHPRFRADMADRYLRKSLPDRYKYYPPYELYAGLFAGIQDIASRYFKGLGRNTDRNNYAVIAEYLRDHSRPWMGSQWKRLAAFTVNRDVRICAEALKSLEIPAHDAETADELDRNVEKIRTFRKRIWTAEWIRPFLPDPGDPALRRR